MVEDLSMYDEIQISWILHECQSQNNPGSKVYGANMGPTWGQQDSGGSHVGPMNLAIWEPKYIKMNIFQNTTFSYIYGWELSISVIEAWVYPIHGSLIKRRPHDLFIQNKHAK